MLDFEKALEIIKQYAAPCTPVQAELSGCLNRILAQDVYSDMDMPPFNRSAVDGYACRRDDLLLEMKVLEVIPAGSVPQYAVGRGECSKLMTGGMVPEGADTVIMVEDTEAATPGFIRFTGQSSGRNYTLKAEDIAKGDRVLSAGTLLRPQEIAVLASVGCNRPLVSPILSIGIISTGDELVEPDAVPALSQIRNSNAWQLQAQVQQAGCTPHYFGIARDDQQATLTMINDAASTTDIVLLTGGISAGDFDFVPEVVQQAGFDIKFRKLAVQPGKPVIFATKGNKYLFALPGNPVSSFVQFELLVKYLISLLTGNRTPAPEVTLPLGVDYSRRNAGRKAFFPVHITPDGKAVPVEYHGSAHIHSYIYARGIVSIPQGTLQLTEGTPVNVRLL